MLTPHDFVDRWANSALRENQGAQSHFNELCELVGHKTPAQMDPAGTFFTFEENVSKATGGQGRADVWYRGHFAWEYKGKHKDLNTAYAQLLAYRGGLGNPPLLVVCDFLEYRIYPQWPNISAQPFVFHNEDLLNPNKRRYISWLLENPLEFLEQRNRELGQREILTLRLAGRFAELADMMRQHRHADGTTWEPIQVARFLTKLVFVLFAEDVGLLPRFDGLPVLRYIAKQTSEDYHAFVSSMEQLFRAMDGRTRSFLLQPIPYFNGGLFADSRPGADDGYEVLDITQLLSEGALEILQEVSGANWREVNPTIFGTLFEGALDPSKRAQLGAHYTGESDIRLVIDPVLTTPLMREWEAIGVQAQPLLQRYLSASTLPYEQANLLEQLVTLRDAMLDKLEQTTVLDPACGSGNFLYVSLRAMKDLEARVHRFFEVLNLPFRDVVTPRQLYGIEKDEFAASLAKVVVWIGYLQWRYDEEGVLHPQTHKRHPHARALPNPILRDKNTLEEPDRIVCDDAILRYTVEGEPYEPAWPAVDVIVGNPPFLGGKRLREELGSAYLNDMFKLYRGRVPAEADLVCYWYEKARTSLEQKTVKRAGLLATNSIRQPVNRTVLERIKQTGDIFRAYSDRPLTLKGAAVRISIVCFDDGTDREYFLDGAPVDHINSDLQNTIDATKARRLDTNLRITFLGDTKGGSFDIDGESARTMLAAANASGRSNADVVRPWVNGLDITRRSRDMWIIDFGVDMPLAEAQLYELPLQHVQQHVYPERQKNRRQSYRDRWWIHVEARPGMRRALAKLPRYIATSRVAKHRLFVWLDSTVLPDSATFAFARSDDYFFGILHSYLHERWALRLGSTLEDRPKYVAETCFDTFPFPYAPGTEDFDSEPVRAISQAAAALHAERDLWLQAPELSINGSVNEKRLALRTLTHLYNALEVYRTEQLNAKQPDDARKPVPRLAEQPAPKLTDDARRFAPRLADLHDALDAAVLRAYGWDDLVGQLRQPDADEDLLRRLLAENVRRAAILGAAPDAEPEPDDDADDSALE